MWPFFSLHLPPLSTWCLSSHLKCRLSLVFIFHLSLLGVSTCPYLVCLKPPQARPFFSLHLPPLPTWCLSSHIKCGLSSFVCIFHLSLLGVSTCPYLVSLKPPQARPFFSLHLPPLSNWCLSSHLKRGLSLVCIFHLSLLGVSTCPYLVSFKPPQARPFFSLASSTSLYLVSLKPPQARPFFSLHLPHLPTWCLSSHLKHRLSLVFNFHLSL